MFSPAFPGIVLSSVFEERKVGRGVRRSVLPPKVLIRDGASVDAGGGHVRPNKTMRVRLIIDVMTANSG